MGSYISPEVQKLGLMFDIYTHYVNDMVIVMRAIGKVWTYNDRRNKLIYDSNCVKPFLGSLRFILPFANISNQILFQA